MLTWVSTRATLSHPCSLLAERTNRGPIIDSAATLP